MKDSQVLAQPSRRQFLWGAGAAALLTAIGGVAVHAQQNFAAKGASNVPAAKPDAQNAPTVSEEDAKDLFRLMTGYTTDVMEENFLRRRTGVGDPVYGFSQKARSLDEWNANYPEMLKGWNGDAVLRGLYMKVTTDQRRATIVAFKAMGGVEWAKQAGAVGFTMTVDENAFFASPSAINTAVRVFGDTQSAYDGKNMTFTQKTASIANDLLWSAYQGQYKTGNFDAFLHSPAMNDTVFTLVKRAVVALGIQQNSTIALNSAGHHRP